MVSFLDRPTYGVGQAAGLLGLRTDSVRRWLDGYFKDGTSYPPVVRPESLGIETVTWGEFIELGYLREYRRANVSLQRLRPAIDKLRVQFETQYPLALVRPLVFDRELVLQVQEELDLPSSLAFVVRSGQTIAVADNANRFFKKIEFNPGENGEAIRIRPAGQTSPVTIDPQVSFGEPAVEGVATSRLWELFDAGETVEDLAGGYELSVSTIGAGIAYEEQLRTFAA